MVCFFQTPSVCTLFGRISLRWATCAKVNLKIAAVAATAAAASVAPRPAIKSAPRKVLRLLATGAAALWSTRCTHINNNPAWLPSAPIHTVKPLLQVVYMVFNNVQRHSWQHVCDALHNSV